MKEQSIAEIHVVPLGIPFTMGAQRVSTTLYIDDRRDKLGSMEGKVKAVEDKLKS